MIPHQVFMICLGLGFSLFAMASESHHNKAHVHGVGELLLATDKNTVGAASSWLMRPPGNRGSLNRAQVNRDRCRATRFERRPWTADLCRTGTSCSLRDPSMVG